MKAEQIKVGDTLRIRQWDDMEEEFGLDIDGDIQCQYEFTNEMKRLSGREVVVSGIDPSDNEIIVNPRVGYYISADMLEPIE